MRHTSVTHRKHSKQSPTDQCYALLAAQLDAHQRNIYDVNVPRMKRDPCARQHAVVNELRIMESKGEEGNKIFVTEYNVCLLVDKNPTCPKKSEVFYNEEITLNRLCWF